MQPRRHEVLGRAHHRAGDLAELDKDLVRLRKLEALNVRSAKPRVVESCTEDDDNDDDDDEQLSDLRSAG